MSLELRGAAAHGLEQEGVGALGSGAARPAVSPLPPLLG